MTRTRVTVPARSGWFARVAGAVALALALGLWLAAGAASAGADQTVLGPATNERALVKPAIVNGTELSIRDVPWQVHVRAMGVQRMFQCGGSILAPTVVVTAAHCVFDPDGLPGTRFAPSTITVQAGVSHTTTPEDGDEPQRTLVAEVTPHPYYVFDQASGGVAPDDVALLRLATPLTLDGPATRAIGLAAGVPLGSIAAGTSAFITGFGRQTVGQPPNGNLYGVATTVADQLRCGGAANAVVLCVQSPTGSACEGDSGGPLTVAGLLAGVASFVTLNEPSGQCGIGSTNGYTNVAAGEIAEFLRGNPTPPRAPRGGSDVGARGAFHVGGTMTCNSGTWTESPTFAFAFVDTRNGELLQSGAASDYVFKAGDLGRTVACTVSAANAGGTGFARTQASAPIAPAPPPPTPPRSEAPARPVVRISIRSARASAVPGASVAYGIRVVNRGTAAARRVVVCAAPGRGLALGRRLPPGGRRAGPRVCWRIGALAPRATRTLRVTLRVTPVHRTRTVVNTVSVTGANFGRRVASSSVRVRAA